MYGSASMVNRMKTTMNIDDELLRRAKRRAVERGTTVTSIVEEALRDALSTVERRTEYRLAFPTGGEPGATAFDPADRSALHDRMDTRT